MIRVYTRPSFYVTQGETSQDSLAAKEVSRVAADGCSAIFVSINGGLVTVGSEVKVWGGVIQKSGDTYETKILLSDGTGYDYTLTEAFDDYRGHRLFSSKDSGGNWKIYAVYLQGGAKPFDIVAELVPIGGGFGGTVTTLISDVDALWDVMVVPRVDDPSKNLVLLSYRESGYDRIAVINGADFSLIDAYPTSGSVYPGSLILLYGETILDVIQDNLFALSGPASKSCVRYVRGFNLDSQNHVVSGVSTVIDYHSPTPVQDDVLMACGGYLTETGCGSLYYGRDSVYRIGALKEKGRILTYPSDGDARYGPWVVSLMDSMAAKGGPCTPDDPKPILRLIYGGDVQFEAPLGRLVSPREVFVSGEGLDFDGISVVVRDRITGTNVQYVRQNQRFQNPGQDIHGDDLVLQITMHQPWFTGASIDSVVGVWPDASNRYLVDIRNH